MHVEHQVTNARSKVMQIRPDQAEQYNFDQRAADQGLHFKEGEFGSDAFVEKRQENDWERQEQHSATDAVQNGQLARQG